ncbi:unnamed protein product [Ixodes hexagonus]
MNTRTREASEASLCGETPSAGERAPRCPRLCPRHSKG